VATGAIALMTVPGCAAMFQGMNVNRLVKWWRRKLSPSHHEPGLHQSPKLAYCYALDLARCERIARSIQSRDERVPDHLRMELGIVGGIGQACTDSKTLDGEHLLFIKLDAHTVSGLNDEELTALIGHEIGHFIYQFSPWWMRYVLATLWSAPAPAVATMASYKYEHYMASGAFGLVTVACMLCNWHAMGLLSWSTDPIRLMRHRIEHACDRYAASVSSPEAVISEFITTFGLHPEREFDMDKGSASHPSYADRFAHVQGIPSDEQAAFTGQT